MAGPQGLDLSPKSPLMQNGWGFYMPQLQALGAVPTDEELQARKDAATATSRAATELPYQRDQERQASQLVDADTADQVDAGVGSHMAARALTRAMAQKTGMAQADSDAFFQPGQTMKRGAETEDFLKRQEPKVDIANNKNIADQVIQSLKNAGSLGVAQTNADAREGSATTTAAINALGHVEGSGFAGRPEVAPVAQKLQSMVEQKTGQTPGVGSYPPDVERKIASAVSAGYSRAQAIARLKELKVIDQ